MDDQKFRVILSYVQCLRPAWRTWDAHMITHTYCVHTVGAPALGRRALRTMEDIAVLKTILQMCVFGSILSPSRLTDARLWIYPAPPPAGSVFNFFQLFITVLFHLKTLYTFNLWRSQLTKRRGHYLSFPKDRASLKVKVPRLLWLA